MRAFFTMQLAVVCLLLLGAFGSAAPALADPVERPPLGGQFARPARQDPTATPSPSPTTKSPLVSDDPAEIQTLILKALAKNAALKSYQARIGFEIGSAWVQDSRGEYYGTDVHFTNDSDWYSEYSENILKDGVVYTRKAGDQSAPWSKSAKGAQSVAYATDPLALMQALVTAPSAFRFVEMRQVGSEECAIYTHQEVSELETVLGKVSERLRFPLTKENSGGLKAAASGVALCPSGYLAGVFVTTEFNQSLAPMVLLLTFSDMDAGAPIAAPPGFAAKTIATPTRALTPTLVLSPTVALSPTLVLSPTVVLSPTAALSPTRTATRTATATATRTATVTPTKTAAASATAPKPTTAPPTARPAPTKAPQAAAPFNVSWNKGFEYLARDGNSFWCQMHNQVQNLTDQEMPFQSPDVKIVDLLTLNPVGPLGGFQPIVGIANGDGTIAKWQLAGWYAKAFGWRNGIEEFPPHGIAAKGDSGDWTWYGVNQAGQYCKYVYVKWNGHTVAAEFSPQGELVNPNAALPAGAP